MAWNEWKRMFDTYMDAIDSEQFTDKRKTALLIHSLGAEGQRRYSKFNPLAFTNCVCIGLAVFAFKALEIPCLFAFSGGKTQKCKYYY